MLAPWKKNYDKTRQHIKKQRHYFANKVHLVKAVVFPVVMYGCESWTIKKAMVDSCQCMAKPIQYCKVKTHTHTHTHTQKHQEKKRKEKKAEHWKIDAFELWCWRRLLRVPWTARISNQSILKEISPEYSLEGVVLKLKLQYFGQLRQRTNSMEKNLMLGKIEGRRRRGWQRMRWLDGITDLIDMSLSRRVGEGQGSLACHSPWCHKELDTTERLNWTDCYSWLSFEHQNSEFSIIISCITDKVTS